MDNLGRKTPVFEFVIDENSGEFVYKVRKYQDPRCSYKFGKNDMITIPQKAVTMEQEQQLEQEYDELMKHYWPTVYEQDKMDEEEPEEVVCTSTRRRP